MAWWKKRTNSRSRSELTLRPELPAERFIGGTITGLELEKRAGSERVNVSLDGAYAFSLAADIGLRLTQGQRLDPATIEDLLTRDQAERAFQRALGFLALRPRSASEVRRRLSEQGHSRSAIDAALQRLEHLELVGDRQFAGQWVAQRQASRPRGPRALRSELRQKGIDADIVDEVLGPVAAEQEEAAYRAGLRKARTLDPSDRRSFDRALAGHLIRRGFDYGVVRTVVRRLWQGPGAESRDRIGP